ncbi:DoxX family protein [Paucibacter sp. M5-1]|uniref:DoxX family protein n=1 Tax=Paucibacter sp. M5-1 TaxID=3015998 RepID=UPI0022B910C6|nr:DoxX family protein [Paucibacter sp. M5-1]MCZ7880617.1 DoxX family protein [Paucibacter sp. M5-1]
MTRIPLSSQVPLGLLRRVALFGLLLPYLISAVSKLLDWPGAQAEVQALTGIASGFLVAVVAAGVTSLQLVCSLWLLADWRGAWLAGVALSAFTLAATLLAHTWWGLPVGPERQHAFNGFWEHIAICCALGFAALVSAREGADR